MFIKNGKSLFGNTGLIVALIILCVLLYLSYNKCYVGSSIENFDVNSINILYNNNFPWSYDGNYIVSINVNNSASVYNTLNLILTQSNKSITINGTNYKGVYLSHNNNGTTKYITAASFAYDTSSYSTNYYKLYANVTTIDNGNNIDIYNNKPSDYFIWYFIPVPNGYGTYYIYSTINTYYQKTVNSVFGSYLGYTSWLPNQVVLLPAINSIATTTLATDPADGRIVKWTIYPGSFNPNDLNPITTAPAPASTYAPLPAPAPMPTPMPAPAPMSASTYAPPSQPVHALMSAPTYAPPPSPVHALMPAPTYAPPSPPPPHPTPPPNNVRLQISGGTVTVNFTIDNSQTNQIPIKFVIVLGQYDSNKKNTGNNKFILSNESEINSNVINNSKNTNNNMCSLYNGKPSCQYILKNNDIRDPSGNLYYYRLGVSSVYNNGYNSPFVMPYNISSSDNMFTLDTSIDTQSKTYTDFLAYQKGQAQKGNVGANVYDSTISTADGQYELIKSQLGNYPDNLLLDQQSVNQDSLNDLVDKTMAQAMLNVNIS